MKNMVKLFGVIALVAVIGFSMAACATAGNTGGSTKKFEDFKGKWVNESAISKDGYTEYSFTFTGNTFVFRAVDANGGIINRPGTFTFTDTRITYIPQQANTWPGYTQEYTLTGNTLLLEDPRNGRQFGTFIKQE